MPGLRRPHLWALIESIADMFYATRARAPSIEGLWWVNLQRRTVFIIHRERTNVALNSELRPSRFWVVGRPGIDDFDLQCYFLRVAPIKAGSFFVRRQLQACRSPPRWPLMVMSALSHEIPLDGETLVLPTGTMCGIVPVASTKLRLHVR